MGTFQILKQTWWWWFSHQVVLTLATPWTIACQAPQSMGFSRQEYWSGLPFPSPGDLPNPGIEPRSLALQADSLPAEPAGKPRYVMTMIEVNQVISLCQSWEPVSSSKWSALISSYWMLGSILNFLHSEVQLTYSQLYRPAHCLMCFTMQGDLISQS